MEILSKETELFKGHVLIFVLLLLTRRCYGQRLYKFWIRIAVRMLIFRGLGYRVVDGRLVRLVYRMDEAHMLTTQGGSKQNLR
jgi:hypothetical protein